MFFLEGVQHFSKTLPTGRTGSVPTWQADGKVGSTNWGDAFGDGSEVFLSDVLKKPYKDQVVLSPHVYPPSVGSEKILQ